MKKTQPGLQPGWVSLFQRTYGKRKLMNIGNHWHKIKFFILRQHLNRHFDAFGFDVTEIFRFLRRNADSMLDARGSDFIRNVADIDGWHEITQIQNLSGGSRPPA